MKIALRAIKLGVAAFLVPYLFVLQPVLLLQGATYLIVLSLVSGAAGIAMVAMAIEGYFLSPLIWCERACLGVGGLTLLYPGLISDGIGLLLLMTGLGIYRLRRRARSAQMAG